MRNEYRIKDNMVIGRLGLKDLKDICGRLRREGCVTVKNRGASVSIQTKRTLSRYARYVYTCGEIETDKFSDVARLLSDRGLYPGLAVIKFQCDVAEVDGDIVPEADTVVTCDTEERMLAAAAYYCETDGGWHASDDGLVEIDGSWYSDDDPNIFWCERCETWHIGDAVEVHTGSRTSEMWCEDCVDLHTDTCEGCGEVWTCDETYRIDRPELTVCPDCYEDGYCYCGACGETVSSDIYDYDEDCCDVCAEERARYVKGYHWHHNNSYTNEGMLFMPKGKMVRLGQAAVRDTCGVELEVNKAELDRHEQNETCEELDRLVPNKNELCYEHDGSLSEGGFEIITGVHTFAGIRALPWERILGTLRDRGYVSHDGGKCGLHVHIGRKFFGKSENAQADAIGKIYAFYAEFWDDITRASRRTSFYYCAHPYEEFSRDGKSPSEIKTEITDKAKLKAGSHGLALNNSNPDTFEFRLGRGTLKYESFMAWLDLTLTVAGNSRRISVRGMHDCDRWLDGISEETAVYLKSRGCFKGSRVIESLTKEEVATCA